MCIRDRIDLEDEVSFLLAVNAERLFSEEIKENPNYLAEMGLSELDFWIVDNHGNMHDVPEEHVIDYLCLGSGREYASEYIEQQIESDDFDPNNIDHRTAFRLACHSIIAARDRDAGTGGFIHPVVFTKNGIRDYYKKFKTDRDKAELKSIEDGINDLPYTNPQRVQD